MERASGIILKYEVRFGILIGVCLCISALTCQIYTFAKNKQ